MITATEGSGPGTPHSNSNPKRKKELNVGEGLRNALLQGLQDENEKIIETAVNDGEAENDEGEVEDEKVEEEDNICKIDKFELWDETKKIVNSKG